MGTFDNYDQIEKDNRELNIRVSESIIRTNKIQIFIVIILFMQVLFMGANFYLSVLDRNVDELQSDKIRQLEESTYKEFGI